MRVASGNQTFFVETAEQSRRGYIEYVNKLNAQTVRTQLQQNINQENPDHLEKPKKISTDVAPA